MIFSILNKFLIFTSVIWIRHRCNHFPLANITFLNHDLLHWPFCTIDLYETTENMTSFCTFHYFKLHYYPVIFQIPLPFVSFNNSNDQIHPHQWNSQSLFGLSSLRHHFSVLSHHNGRINTSFKSFRCTYYFVIMVICTTLTSFIVLIWLLR